MWAVSPKWRTEGGGELGGWEKLEQGGERNMKVKEKGVRGGEREKKNFKNNCVCVCNSNLKLSECDSVYSFYHNN